MKRPSFPGHPEEIEAVDDAMAYATGERPPSARCHRAGRPRPASSSRAADRIHCSCFAKGLGAAIYRSLLVASPTPRTPTNCLAFASTSGQDRLFRGFHTGGSLSAHLPQPRTLQARDTASGRTVKSNVPGSICAPRYEHAGTQWKRSSLRTTAMPLVAAPFSVTLLFRSKLPSPSTSKMDTCETLPLASTTAARPSP